MPYADYRSIINSIARTKSSQLQVFADFCKISACALALCSREDEYHAIATHYSSDEMHEFSTAFASLVNEMEEKPFTDILGDYYLEFASHSSKQARGEFFTPPNVSKMIARMLFDKEAVKAKGLPITVKEPACGSGGMVLAVAELFAPDSVDLLRVTCQDINPLATDMCFINTTLWGIPAQIILGDTIRKTETEHWKNPHWHRVGEDQRQMMRQVLDLITSTADVEKPFTDQLPLGAFREVNGQFELDLGSQSSMALKR